MEETEDFTTEVTELTENNFWVFSPLTPLALWWHTLLPLPTPFTLQPRDLDQLGCHSFDVFLHRELREDVFERGGGHELPQPGRRVVGHDAAGTQDDDSRAELFDRLELVRTVEDDSPVSRERPHDRPQHQRRADVETRHRLVQDDQPRVVDASRREQDLLPHALREGGQRGVIVDVQSEQMQEAIDFLLQGARGHAP